MWAAGGACREGWGVVAEGCLSASLCVGSRSRRGESEKTSYSLGPQAVTQFHSRAGRLVFCGTLAGRGVLACPLTERGSPVTQAVGGKEHRLGMGQLGVSTPAVRGSFSARVSTHQPPL